MANKRYISLYNYLFTVQECLQYNYIISKDEKAPHMAISDHTKLHNMKVRHNCSLLQACKYIKRLNCKDVSLGLV